MKPKLYVLAAALVLSVVATGASYAQQHPLSVEIPFAFQAGDHTLPAGKYLVDSTVSGTRAVQRLRQVDGNAVMVVMTIPVEASNGRTEPELVFNCYGQTKFLSQIWTGDSEGRHCSSPTVRSVPQSEKEDAKLHCFCNQQASDRNFSRHVASSFISTEIAHLAGTRKLQQKREWEPESWVSAFHSLSSC